MTIKVTIPNTSSDSLTFGSGNTPTAAQVIGIDSGSSNGQLAFNTTASGTSTERMRIDASGNVGIGTSSPSTKLHVSGGSSSVSGTNGVFGIANGNTSGGMKLYAYTAAGTANGYLAFEGYDREYGRFDSSGNLLVGTTSATSSSRLKVQGSGATGSTTSFNVYNSAGTEMCVIADNGVFYTGKAAFSPYNNTTGSAANLFVGANGDLYRSTSSLKYKTNVQDAAHGLADVLKLRAVTYEGKAQSDAGKTFGGLIAEEVHEAGLTEFVQYAEDGSPDALAYGNMVSLCIKAIQEQQALITTLTERISALEAK